MSSTRSKKFVLALVLLVSVFGVGATQSQGATSSHVTVKFQVTYRSVPLSSVTVSFIKDGKVTAKQTTASNGLISVTMKRGTRFDISARRYEYCGYYSFDGALSVPTSGPSTLVGAVPLRYTQYSHCISV